MRGRGRMIRTWAACAAVLLLAGGARQAVAQPLSAASGLSGPAPAGVMRVDLANLSRGAQNLSIPRGKSAIVELPTDARDVLVTNPQVADAVLRSPRRIYVLGVAAGQTDAVFFDAAGRRILSLNIRVDQDVGALAETLARVLPGSSVHVEAINDSVILTGQVASASDSDRANQVAARFVSKPEQVLNMLSLTGKDQVMLKVRVVEMQRNIIKQFGVNANVVLNQLGQPQYGFGFTPTYGVNGNLLGGLTGGYSLDTTRQPLLASPSGCANTTVRDRSNPANCVGTGLAGSSGVNQATGMIQAFERVGLVRTLAEPNLTAVSGESAKFLAGGEYPVPVGQDSTGRVTLEFKPYGVGLGFTPVVLSGGRISLKVSTEVSELTSLGAFSLTQSSTTSSGGTTNTTSGPALVVPGLSVRRAESTVELPSGGALMMAGLLQEKTKENLDSLPGMNALPVLGALARSRDFQSGETELVVLVTAYIVSPTSPNKLQTPVDGLQFADDAETLLLGRLNKAYKAPAAATAGRSYQGPVGYVIQ